MAELKVTIRLEGAILRDEDQRDGQLAAILRGIADNLEDGVLDSYRQTKSLFDDNGNRVGSAKLHNEE